MDQSKREVCTKVPSLSFIIYIYAVTVIVPAAVPILAAFVITALSVVPASLTVPPLSAIALAPIDRTSSASVAAFAAPIANVNTNSLVPVQLAYDNV